MNVDPYSTFVSDAAPVPTESEYRSFIGEEEWIEGYGAKRTAGVSVTERSALSLSPLLASWIVLSTDCAVIPIHVYQRKTRGNGRAARPNHRLERLLRLTPDGELTPVVWLQVNFGHAMLWGTGLAEIVRDGDGTPARLHHLNPETTEPYRTESGELKYRLSNGRSLYAWNVFRLIGPSLDGIQGVRVVRTIAESIGLAMAAQGFAADYFANGAEPGMTIEVPHKLTREAKTRLRSDWNADHKGTGRRHGVAVLEMGAKVNAWGADPQRSQVLETRKFQTGDVPRPWRVPPNKYGDLSEAHLANLEASNQDYVQNALMFWLVGWCQEANLKLFTAAEQAAGYYVEHNLDALLRANITARFAAYGKALNDGWINRDEVRAKENLNPIGKAGGGDKFTLAANLTTLENIGQDVRSPNQVPANPADPAVDADATPGPKVGGTMADAESNLDE